MTKAAKSKKISKKIGYVGQDRKAYVHEPTAIILPSADRLAELAKELELSEDGKHNLEIVLRHIKEDLDQMRFIERTAEERQDLIARLLLIERKLDDLRYECDRHAPVMNDIVPVDARAFIGHSLTFTAISELLGKDVVPDHVKNQSGEVDILALEKSLEPARETLGVKYGGSLFVGLIRRIHNPLKLWVENHAKLNTNSGYRRVARNHLLYWLIYEAEDILGPDGVQKPGKLTRLCKAMVVECGLDEQGLDSAIKRMKDQVQQEKADRQFAHTDPVTSSVN